MMGKDEFFLAEKLIPWFHSILVNPKGAFHAPFEKCDVLEGTVSPKSSRWWFQICFIFTPILGEDSHFDEHIFQLG